MKTLGLTQKKFDYLHYFFSTQLRLMRRPDLAFEELFRNPDLIRMGVIFFMSAALYCCASLIFSPTGQPVAQAAVLALNTIGMVLVEIVIGYILVAILTGTFVSLKMITVIYAVSWATMLMIAWIPFSLWLTEPWKWLLIGIGLKKQYHLKGWKAILIVLSSIVLIVWIFNRFIPSGVTNIG